MLRNLFARHDDVRTVLHSPDAMTSSRAPSQEYATLGPMAIPQAGPAATRYLSASSSLSPVVQAAVARVTGNPIA